jgi:hypothetical protein
MSVYYVCFIIVKSWQNDIMSVPRRTYHDIGREEEKRVSECICIFHWSSHRSWLSASPDSTSVLRIRIITWEIEAFPLPLTAKVIMATTCLTAVLRSSHGCALGAQELRGYTRVSSTHSRSYLSFDSEVSQSHCSCNRNFANMQTRGLQMPICDNFVRRVCMQCAGMRSGRIALEASGIGALQENS